MAKRSQRLTLLQRKAEEGHARAQYELGLAYYRGDGVEKDLAKARHWLANAAAQGDRDATVLLNLRGMELNRGVEFRFGPASKNTTPRPTPPAEDGDTYESEAPSVRMSGDELLAGLREILKDTEMLLPAQEPMRDRLIAILTAMVTSVQTRRMPMRSMRDRITPGARTIELTLKRYRGARYDRYRARLIELCRCFLEIEMDPPVISRPVKHMPDESRLDRVARLTDLIEAELRSLGWWSGKPPTDEQMKFKAAFGMDTMPLSMWIQFVLLERVREIIRQNGTFPGRSMVGTQAIREYDGRHEAANLVSLLCEFDEAVMGG